MDDAPTKTAPNAIKLNCLEGKPVPPIVLEGWRHLKAFPPKAWQSFWLLLAPMLLAPGHKANQELLALFCEGNKVAPEAVLAAVGCCEVLLKQAAALDLEEDALRQDLVLLSEGADDLARFMGERFPEAKKELRKQIFMESLAAHGKVMTGLEWRLDKIQHSSRGNRLNTDIVILTLSYREGQRQEHISLQLTQEAALELKVFCNRLP